MIIGGKTVTEIIVTNKNDVLVASITDEDIINGKDYSVILNYSESCRPDSQLV